MATGKPSEIVAKLHGLPSLPTKCARLEALMNEPESSFADMTRVIETDVGLASKVLKLANSAHYSISGGVHSLEKAVIYLGMTTIYQMVLCMQSQQILGQQGRALPEALAGHSLAVALIAKHVSEQMSLPLPDRAFSAGLLHDFGRLATHVLFPDLTLEYAQAVQRGAEHSLELEMEIFGIDHQQVGAELAQHWRYPRGLAWVIADHHGPGQEVRNRAEKDYQLVSDIVALADAWSWQLSWPGVVGAAQPRLHPDRTERLGLPAEPGEEHRSALTDLAERLPGFLKG